jgi:hypothetical protein
MAFKKGQSGNPGGKKPIDPQVKKLLSSKCLWAVKGIIKLAESSEDDGIRLKSFQYLVDRELGKAPQAINLADAEGEKLSIQVIIQQAGGKT